MALHVDGVHTGYAIVLVLAAAAARWVIALAHAVDEIGLSDERTPHLHEFETAVENRLYIAAVDDATNVYQRQLQLAAELERIFQKIALLEGIIMRPAIFTPSFSHGMSI